MESKQVTEFVDEIAAVGKDLARVEEEFGRHIVGNRKILGYILKAMLSGGHVLLEGAPGLGKTLMIKTVAQVLDLKFRRVQFTPDLMPADIIGTNIIVEDGHGDRNFKFEQGPLFTNILLADEINRASPKTQSALLQAMEEHEVTVFGKSYYLDNIFFTLATQNPIEMAGTYPLPEAQLDRFFFKLIIPFPSDEELKKIGILNMNGDSANRGINTLLARERILEMRNTLLQLPITDRIYDFAVKLVQRTHSGNEGTSDNVSRFVRYGASPRGLNTLLASARVSAAMDGRINISIDDIEENYLPALRHRLVMRFESEIEGVYAEDLLEEIFSSLRKHF